MAFVLKNLSQKTQKQEYYTIEDFKEMLCENLENQGFGLTMDLAASMVKGVNVAVLKKNKPLDLLEVLQKIKEKHKLTYKLIEVPNSKPLNKFSKIFLKCVSSPYGETGKTTLKTIPLLLEVVLREL